MVNSIQINFIENLLLSKNDSSLLSQATLRRQHQFTHNDAPILVGRTQECKVRERTHEVVGVFVLKSIVVVRQGFLSGVIELEFLRAKVNLSVIPEALEVFKPIGVYDEGWRVQRLAIVDC